MEKITNDCSNNIEPVGLVDCQAPNTVRRFSLYWNSAKRRPEAKDDKGDLYSVLKFEGNSLFLMCYKSENPHRWGVVVELKKYD